ncbi:MAG TPA: hypothetical protein VGB22_01645 [candidate division Zixibacteria bacterium]
MLSHYRITAKLGEGGMGTIVIQLLRCAKEPNQVSPEEKSQTLHSPTTAIAAMETMGTASIDAVDHGPKPWRISRKISCARGVLLMDSGSGAQDGNWSRRYAQVFELERAKLNRRPDSVTINAVNATPHPLQRG